jgi:hypothetical protein
VPVNVGVVKKLDHVVIVAAIFPVLKTPPATAHHTGLVFNPLLIIEYQYVLVGIVC